MPVVIEQARTTGTPTSLGPNGAGKTTSMNILMGFVYASSDRSRVFGYEPGDVRAKERIGFLPENFAFYRYHSRFAETIRLDKPPDGPGLRVGLRARVLSAGGFRVSAPQPGSRLAKSQADRRTLSRLK